MDDLVLVVYGPPYNRAMVVVDLEHMGINPKSENVVVTDDPHRVRGLRPTRVIEFSPEAELADIAQARVRGDTTR